MRKYKKGKELSGVPEEVICNSCSRNLKIENGILTEGCFHARHSFGYFSNKDGKEYEIDLCEECFDRWIAGFSYPVRAEDRTEFL